MDSNCPVKVLFLAADPSDAARLRLGQELRDIREKLQLSKHRDRFILESRESIRPGDITQAIFDVEPQIVHFSGHGSNTGELLFEDESGKVHPIQPNALAALFKLVADQVNCIILNACYSEIQAKAIANHIPFVIGMNQAIGDKAAIAFSMGFYTALGANRSIEIAYEVGCVQIQLQDIPEHLTPVLLSRIRESTTSVNTDEKATKEKVQWVLVLSGTIDDVKKPQAEAIVVHLRQLLKDPSLTLQKIEAGSIKLFLEGSQEGFEQIEFLFQTEQINEVAGFPIQEIQQVVQNTRSSIQSSQSIQYKLRSGSGYSVFFSEDLKMFPEPLYGTIDKAILQGRIWRVKFNGSYWFARLFHSNQRITLEPGQTVRIFAIRGTTLLIAPIASSPRG